jgi:hypothetical protein
MTKDAQKPPFAQHTNTHLMILLELFCGLFPVCRMQVQLAQDGESRLVSGQAEHDKIGILAMDDVSGTRSLVEEALLDTRKSFEKGTNAKMFTLCLDHSLAGLFASE